MGYSKDFKDKVIEIMTREQLSVRKAAQYFNLSTHTIQQWKKSTVRKPIPGRPAKITEMHYIKQEYRVKKDVNSSTIRCSSTRKI